MKKILLAGGIILLLIYFCWTSIDFAHYETVPMSRADSFVVRFASAHPDMKKNEIELDEAGKEFMKLVKPFVKDSNGLAGMPLKIAGMEAKNAKLSIVHFESVKPIERKADAAKQSGPQEIAIELFAVMSTDSAKKLEHKNGVWYQLEGYSKVVKVDETNNVVGRDIIHTRNGDFSKDPERRAFQYNFGSYVLEPKRVVVYQQ